MRPVTAAALAGLAPYDRASGTYDGKRSIHGGRRRLRKALYLAAVSPYITGAMSVSLCGFHQR